MLLGDLRLKVLVQVDFVRLELTRSRYRCELRPSGSRASSTGSDSENEESALLMSPRESTL